MSSSAFLRILFRPFATRSQMRGGLTALLAAVTLLAHPALASAGGTYYTDSDNENNAGTGIPDNDMDASVGQSSANHPIEFNINLTGAIPTQSAYLSVRAYDVDEEEGETDDVYFNDTYLGKLSGQNNTWSSSAFAVPLSLVHAGNNKVSVIVDTSGDATVWVVTVDWGQLVTDGGAADKADTTRLALKGVNIAGDTVTLNNATSVQIAQAGTYSLEINLIDPQGNNSSVLSQTFAARAGQSLARSFTPTYSLSGVSGIYTVQAQLFYDNNGFPLQQDIETLAFEHVSGHGPTFPASTLSVSPTVISVNDNGSANLLLQLIDLHGTALTGSGGTVTLHSTLGQLSAVTDNNDGTYTATLNAGTTTGTAVLSGEINGNPLPANASVHLIADRISATRSVLSASTNRLIANGTNNAALALQLKDAHGNDIDFGGAAVSLSTSRGTIGPITDHGNGTYEAVYTAPGTLGALSLTNTITPTINGATGTPISLTLLLDPLGDEDGDGIPNQQESTTTDTDNDGLPDYLDTDADGDGVPDSVELTGDADHDGIPDYLDHSSDEDHDGAPDIIETIVDSDGDGIPDCFDVDSDNDGIPDALESGLTGQDSDNDGIDDAFDVDATHGIDANLDGIDDNFKRPDHDHDGVVDALDTDSDNDGLSDTQETIGTPHDADNDGIDDSFDVDVTGGVDNNHDGIDDHAQLNDSNHDGIPDAWQRPDTPTPPDTDPLPPPDNGNGNSDTDHSGNDDTDTSANQNGGDTGQSGNPAPATGGGHHKGGGPLSLTGMLVLLPLLYRLKKASRITQRRRTVSTHSCDHLRN